MFKQNISTKYSLSTCFCFWFEHRRQPKRLDKGWLYTAVVVNTYKSKHWLPVWHGTLKWISVAKRFSCIFTSVSPHLFFCTSEHYVFFLFVGEGITSPSFMWSIPAFPSSLRTAQRAATLTNEDQHRCLRWISFKLVQNSFIKSCTFIPEGFTVCICDVFCPLTLDSNFSPTFVRKRCEKHQIVHRDL